MGIAGLKISIRKRKKIKENEKNRKYEEGYIERKRRERKKTPIDYWWIKGKMTREEGGKKK